MTSFTPLLPKPTPDDLYTFFAGRSSVILVGNPHDQGESAAALAGAIGFFHKKSFETQSYIPSGNALTHVEFLKKSRHIASVERDHSSTLPQPERTAIIALSVASVEELPLFIKNFWEQNPSVPLLNIDRRGHNTVYGTLNIIDEKTSSVSEILYHLFQTIDPLLVDADIATALLTGMIIATKSFRSNNVRPESLALASRLVEQGAEREKIIHHLYRSRSLPTLRLWGIALTRLKNNPSGLVTTVITREDITSTGADSAEIHGVADELLASAPEAHATLLLFEKDAGGTSSIVHALLSSERHSCLELAGHLGAHGHHNRVVFTVPYSSAETAERELTPEISGRMAIGHASK